MTVDEIRELIQLAHETGVAELEVQRGENRVRIRLSFASEAHHPGPAYHVVEASAAEKPAPKSAPEPEADASLILVKSPIVGTFYESSSPDTPPFVRVGEKVAPGKVLCIIESMKLMNEIEAELSGVIAAKLMENGRPVEYGEALFAIRPR